MQPPGGASALVQLVNGVSAGAESEGAKSEGVVADKSAVAGEKGDEVALDAGGSPVATIEHVRNRILVESATLSSCGRHHLVRNVTGCGFVSKLVHSSVIYCVDPAKWSFGEATCFSPHDSVRVAAAPGERRDISGSTNFGSIPVVPVAGLEESAVLACAATANMNERAWADQFEIVTLTHGGVELPTLIERGPISGQCIPCRVANSYFDPDDNLTR